MHPEAERFTGARLVDLAGWLEGRPHRIVARVAPRSAVRGLEDRLPSGSGPDWRVVRLFEQDQVWQVDVTPGNPEALPADRHRRPEEAQRGR